MPLLMLHDIGWPLARRDGYYAPERIPAEHRQPLARNVFLAPDDPGTTTERNAVRMRGRARGRSAQRRPHRGRGLPHRTRRAALREASRRSSGSASSGIPSAPWAEAVGAAVAPWDRNPLLERLEANRVRHMVERYRMTAPPRDRRRSERGGGPGAAGAARARVPSGSPSSCRAYTAGAGRRSRASRSAVRSAMPRRRAAPASERTAPAAAR